MGISIIPWVLYGRWSVFLVTAAGTLLALLTGTLHQWNLEKWPGRRLNLPVELVKNQNSQPGASTLQVLARLDSANTEGNPDVERGQVRPPVAPEISSLSSPPQPLQPKPRLANKKPKSKTVCLTRGNGHRHAMILIGSGSVWDLETLATATSESLPGTPWYLVGLAILWICLLVSVSGMEYNTWYLLGIGGLGMLQNVYAAAAPRKPESLGLAMRPYAERPTIIGTNVDERIFWPKPDTTEQSDDEGASPDDPLLRDKPYLEPWQTVGVRGALRELEKTIPKAGAALMPEYFPTVWKVERERYRDKREARFWRWMFKRPRSKDRRSNRKV